MVEADFTCNVNGVRTIYLRADRGMYVSYISRGGKYTIEASKTEKDIYCRFVVIKA